MGERRKVTERLYVGNSANGDSLCRCVEPKNVIKNR